MSISKFVNESINNSVRNAQMAQNSRASTATAPTTTNVSQVEVKKRQDKHIAKHRLCQKNQAFVKKYGYGDLSDDKVTQYRHKTEAIMKRIKHMQHRGAPGALTQKAEAIIKEAGEVPAKRRSLDNLYLMLCRHPGKTDAKKTATIMDVVSQAPGMKLSSERGRVALKQLLDTKAVRSGKLTPANMTAIVNVAAKSHVTPARIKAAVPAMADYMANAKVAHATLQVSSLTLARMRGTARLKTDPDARALLEKDVHLLEKDLGTILDSDTPARTGANLAERVSQTAKTRAKQVKARCIQEYDAALQRAGMIPERSTEFAQALYDVGGPSSPQGRMLLAVLGRKKIFDPFDNNPLTNPNFRWADDMAKKMNQATGNLQPQKWQKLNISGLLHRGPHRAPEKSWVTKSADLLGDACAITGQLADTGQTLLEVGGHVGLPISAAVVSVGLSIVGGVFTLSQIGYAWRKFEADQKYIYSNKGAWKAVETMATAYNDGKLSQPPDPDKALNWYDGEKGPGVLPAGHRAFNSAFLKTYRKLLSLPRRATAAYCRALTTARSYDWQLWYDESSFTYQGPWDPHKLRSSRAHRPQN